MSCPQPISVFVVDDHAPFIEAARAVVAAAPGFELVGTATSAPEARGRFQGEHDIIDLVLMDIELGDESGLDLTETLTSADPHPVVFLISTMDPNDVGTLAEECGAAAFISKVELSPIELERQWRAVLDGAGEAGT